MTKFSKLRLRVIDWSVAAIRRGRRWQRELVAWGRREVAARKHLSGPRIGRGVRQLAAAALLGTIAMTAHRLDDGALSLEGELVASDSAERVDIGLIKPTLVGDFDDVSFELESLLRVHEDADSGRERAALYSTLAVAPGVGPNGEPGLAGYNGYVRLDALTASSRGPFRDFAHAGGGFRIANTPAQIGPDLTFDLFSLAHSAQRAAARLDGFPHVASSEPQNGLTLVTVASEDWPDHAPLVTKRTGAEGRTLAGEARVIPLRAAVAAAPSMARPVLAAAEPASRTKPLFKIRRLPVDKVVARQAGQDAPLAQTLHPVPIAHEKTQEVPDGSRIQQYARQLVSAGEVKRALKVLYRGLDSANRSIEYVAFVAALEQQVGDHRAAVGHYRSVLARRPDAAIWWVGLAISLEAMEEVDAALAAFQRAERGNDLTPAVSDYIQQQVARLRSLSTASAGAVRTLPNVDT